MSHPPRIGARLNRERSALLVAAVLVAVCGCGARTATQLELDGVHRARGNLTVADTTRLGTRDRYVLYAVRLRSSSGLNATGRLLVPRAGGGAFPAVLLNDGRELNSGVLEYLPRDFGNVVVLSLDYPEELPWSLDVRTLVLHPERAREPAARIPAIFSLGGAFLRAHPAVDSARVAIVATSFAVPFAVIAAAADPGFRNVGLIYGAGDMAGVLAANLTLRPRFLRGPAAWLAMRPFREFAPERFIGRIAPRPIVMVNGLDDPQMPREAVLALHAAARDPRELIWLRTGHLMPTDSALIRTLVDTAFARLPALNPRADSRSADRAGTVLDTT